MKDLELKESEITKQIRDYLTVKGIFHWKAWQGLGLKKEFQIFLESYREAKP